jgi:hypothetical protein
MPSALSNAEVHGGDRGSRLLLAVPDREYHQHHCKQPNSARQTALPFEVNPVNDLESRPKDAL